MDPELKALLQQMIEGQTRTDRMIGDLAQTVTHFVATTDAYVAASDARMKQLEATSTH